ncbi:MAG: UDP-N-acetylmuramate dehydrogenase [Candidatus Promineofilum sp.]|nr:UDP-N-acetylmuramate dehydrogenase [Promineifilum sp.]MBP9656905.1 UDP-N-acetylmuramate dehydrogenase [Promineifilum sp.]
MTTVQTVERLRQIFGNQLQVNESLSRHTTARVGGPAELFLTVTSADQLLTAAEMAYNAGVSYFVLGGGSNILVADSGISGLVIMNRARKVSFRHSGAGVVCTVESGMNLSSLARQCISRGLGGLEWAVGIPGTVGGAVVGNAGAHGSDIDGQFLAATVWEPGFGLRVYNREDMKYGYRDSVLKRDPNLGRARRVVLSAELRLKPEPVNILSARAEGFNAHRKERQPGGASTGSMFKNPENYYAGYLIDTAGLKGFQVGDASISEKHANFFMTGGQATAEDVRSLIAEAWNSVREQFGIEMELEVELVGDWSFE